MNRYLFAMIASLSAVGCQSQDTDQALQTTQNAVGKAGATLKNAWIAANDRIRNLDTDSSRNDLEQAKKQLARTEAETKSNAESQFSELERERLNAIEKLQDARTKLNQKLAEAAKAKDDVQKEAGDAQKELSKIQQDVSDLTQKADQAKSALDQAATKAQNAWKALSP